MVIHSQCLRTTLSVLTTEQMLPEELLPVIFNVHVPAL